MQVKASELQFDRFYYGHWILKPTDHFIGAWFCSNINPWINHGSIFDVSKLFFYQIVGKSGEKLVAEEWSAKKVFEVAETDHFLDVAGRAVPDKKTGRKKKVQPRAFTLGDLSDPNLEVCVFLKESQGLTKEDPVLEWRYAPGRDIDMEGLHREYEAKHGKPFVYCP